MSGNASLARLAKSSRLVNPSDEFDSFSCHLSISAVHVSLSHRIYLVSIAIIKKMSHSKHNNHHENESEKRGKDKGEIHARHSVTFLLTDNIGFCYSIGFSKAVDSQGFSPIIGRLFVGIDAEDERAAIGEASGEYEYGHLLFPCSDSSLSHRVISLSSYNVS